MKETFERPDRPKNQKPPYEPRDGKNDPFWDFRAPQYDQRHSCFIKAGTDYGTGYVQPIGHQGHAKSTVPCLPVNTARTIRLDDGKD